MSDRKPQLGRRDNDVLNWTRQTLEDPFNHFSGIVYRVGTWIAIAASVVMIYANQGVVKLPAVAAFILTGAALTKLAEEGAYPYVFACMAMTILAIGFAVAAIFKHLMP
jgi:hypothetical protein